jgi:hypothetical protein
MILKILKNVRISLRKLEIRNGRCTLINSLALGLGNFFIFGLSGWQTDLLKTRVVICLARGTKQKVEPNGETQQGG